MKTVLTITPHYLPGFKSGGPLVSVRNIVDGLNSEFDFKIVAADRDLGDSAPYSGITAAMWHDVGNAKVRYASELDRRVRAICRIIADTDHDLLYLNSFFAPWATIYPLLGRRLGLVPPKPILLAPRGEFSKGALALKTAKKTTYLLAAKRMGLLRDVQWHASTEFEAEDIARTIGSEENIFIASDLPDQPPAVLPTGPRDGCPDLNVVFLSRVSPKKNLEYAIDVLARSRERLHFHIYGPAEDANYWSRCLGKLDSLPAHLSWTYHGAVSPNEVPAIMRSNDLFFLPTLGENYGHVIAEALSMGTRVLISDQTPWRDLASRGLGHDISLSRPEQFLDIIEELAYQPPKERLKNRMTTHSNYLKNLKNNYDMKNNYEMFRHAMSTF
jgi:glycosyltransferase involved in cell wall biosynthesis